MRRILPILLVLTASCGSLPSAIRPLIRPIGLVKLDSSAEVQSRAGALVLDAGQGSVISIAANPLDGVVIVRYGPKLEVLWQRRTALSSGSSLDLHGVHIQDGRLYAPVLIPHPDEVKEYKVLAFDLATGDGIPAISLMRLNRNDVGAMGGSFWSGGNPTEQQLVQPVWSPDSSKVLLFKKYGAGSGRISIEMLLYKRGFSMITKNNIDFRLDTNTQSLVNILIDNDGVAYFFLRNETDLSMEVGRFEILGSKKLRTIKYRWSSKTGVMGTTAIAARGHAYVASVAADSAKATVQLIDFDFYQNSANAHDLATFAATPVTAGLVPPRVWLSSNENRLIVSNDHGSVTQEITNDLYAFDLDLTPVWHYSHKRPYASVGGQVTAPELRLFDRSIGYCFVQADTLRWRQVELSGGEDLPMYALAIVRGVSEQAIERCTVIGRQIYFIEDRLYRLTLP